jgi:hypothetical protein
VKALASISSSNSRKWGRRLISAALVLKRRLKIILMKNYPKAMFLQEAFVVLAQLWGIIGILSNKVKKTSNKTKLPSPYFMFFLKLFEPPFY